MCPRVFRDCVPMCLCLCAYLPLFFSAYVPLSFMCLRACVPALPASPCLLRTVKHIARRHVGT